MHKLQGNGYDVDLHPKISWGKICRLLPLSHWDSDVSLPVISQIQETLLPCRKNVPKVFSPLNPCSFSLIAQNTCVSDAHQG
jgi:hypothetical protein